jgi:hypothetical protein
MGDLKLHVRVFSSPGVVLYDYGPATADRPLAVPFSLLDSNYYVEVRSDGQTTGQYRIDMHAAMGVYDDDKSHYRPIDGGSYSGQRHLPLVHPVPGRHRRAQVRPAVRRASPRARDRR